MCGPRDTHTAGKWGCEPAWVQTGLLKMMDLSRGVTLIYLERQAARGVWARPVDLAGSHFAPLSKYAWRSFCTGQC